jgi:putative ABC transport system ATP-binding protein
VPHTVERIAFLGEYKKYAYDDIRRCVSHIKPHSDLFDNSIHFNLTFGVKLKPIALSKRIVKYMTKFELGHLVGQLDANISTLSTGEKQRIKLIRCILHDKPIWVLDEGTANLDADCELKVISLLRDIQIRKKKSVIHVTHNEGLTRFSDHLITIRNKKVDIQRTLRLPTL